MAHIATRIHASARIGLLLWSAVIFWSAGIFAGVSFARQVQSFVSETIGRGAFTAAALAFSALPLACVFTSPRRSGRGFKAHLLLVGVVCVFAFWAWQLRPNPEESFHLVEYGLLAALVLAALKNTTKDALPYLTSALIVSLVGTFDEIWQWFTPGRFFDFRDIWLNSAAGMLMLVALASMFPDRAASKRIARSAVIRPLLLAMVQIALLAVCLVYKTSGQAAAKTSHLPAAVKPASLRLVFFTDVHASTEAYATAGMHLAANAIVSQHPQVVIGGGDLIADGTAPLASVVEQQWQAYDAMQGRLPQPAFHVLGNRDILLTKSDGEDPRALFKVRVGEGQAHRSFSVGGYQFILLDSVVMGEGNQYRAEISAGEIAWLQEELKKVGPSVPLVLVSHMPLATRLFPPGQGPANRVVTNSNEIILLLSRHNLVLVLQGHLHDYESFKINRTTFITGGAISGRGWGGPAAEEGFVVADLAGGRVEARYIRYRESAPE